MSLIASKHGRLSSATFPMFHRVHDALLRLGIPAVDLYLELGFVSPKDGAALPRISMEDYLVLLERAASIFRRPSIGLDIAKVRDIDSYALLSSLLKNSPTIGDAARHINTFAKALTPGAVGSLEKKGGLVHWTYSIEGTTAEAARHETEMTLSEIIGALRALLSLPNWSPRRVMFQHSSCGADAALREFSGCEILFDHEKTGMELDQEILSCAIAGADENRYQLLLSQMAKTLETEKFPNDFLGEVNFYLSSKIGFSNCSADAIARDLATSLRTFYRRLALHGESFNSMKQQRLISIAKNALTMTDLTFTEIALQLGYSDGASFSRAFKRETSMTPSQFRAQHVMKGIE